MSQILNPGAVSTTSVETDDTDKIYNRLTWRILPLLCVCYVAAYLDRVNISFAKLQMQSELAFSDAVYGLGAGLFFIGYMLFEVPSNLILQRMGARVWIARIMITWGIISAATMFVTTPMQFYILRFALGVAEAGFYPGVMLYLTLWYPSYRRGKIMAFFLIAIPISGMIGSPISGWIMDFFDGMHDLSGWQWLFLLEALPSIFLGILVLALLPSTIDSTKWLSSAEKERLKRVLEKDQVANSQSSVREAFASLKVWMLGIIDVCLMLAVYCLSFWLPTLIQESGVTSNSQIGVLTGITSILAIGALIINGRSSDRMRERRWHTALPIFLAAISVGLSPFFSSNPLITVVLFSFANIGLMAALPSFWCMPGTFLRGRAAAAGIAIIASMSTLGGIGATVVIGALRDLTQSSQSGMWFVAACLLIAGFMVLGFSKKIVNR